MNKFRLVVLESPYAGEAVLFAIFVAVLGQIVFSVSQKEIDDTQTNTGFNGPRPLSAGG